MPALKVTINLLPEKRLEEKPGGRFLKWCLTYGRYIIIATEIVVLFAFFSRFKLDRELTDLHESIKQKKAIIAEAVEFENEINRTQEKLNQIKILEKKQLFYVELISLLEKLVPSDVVLNQLSITSKEISLNGFSLTSHGFANLSDNLRKSNRFDNIKIGAIGKSKEGGFGLTFNLTAEIIGER